MATHQALPTYHTLPFFHVFPHLHDMTVGARRMALRGQSRFWSYEKGSKAMGVFTAPGVIRSPVTPQDYFSPSCEMAGRWLGRMQLIPEGWSLSRWREVMQKKWARTNSDTTSPTWASRKFRPQHRIQKLSYIYQRKKKRNTWESNTWSENRFPTAFIQYWDCSLCYHLIWSLLIL